MLEAVVDIILNKGVDDGEDFKRDNDFGGEAR